MLQLGKVNRLLLGELARRAPLLPGKDALAFVDIDSMQKRVYGHHKQGAAFGHTKIQGKSLLVRGLNALAATISTPLAAPVIAATRLRGGNAASARGAASFATEAVAHRPRHRVQRDAGGAGRLGVLLRGVHRRRARGRGVLLGHRADEPARQGGDRGDRRGRLDPIKYPRAIWDDQLACWVSDAEVAEVTYTAFTSKKGQAITARLIVRRVKDLNRKAGEGQDELFTVWRYHAVFTDSPFVTSPGRGPAPRPRPGGAGLRRLAGGPAGAPALGLVPRERRLARLRRHRP